MTELGFESRQLGSKLKDLMAPGWLLYVHVHRVPGIPRPPSSQLSFIPPLVTPYSFLSRWPQPFTLLPGSRVRTPLKQSQRLKRDLTTNPSTFQVMCKLTTNIVTAQCGSERWSTQVTQYSGGLLHSSWSTPAAVHNPL